MMMRRQTTPEASIEKAAKGGAGSNPACQRQADTPPFRAIGIPAVAAAAEQMSSRHKQKKTEGLPAYLRHGPFAS